MARWRPVTVALGAFTGFVSARLLWLLLRPAFATPLLRRENYRGRSVATAAGVVMPLALLAVEAGRIVAGAAGVGASGGPDRARMAVLVVAIGMGLGGLFDDLAGSGDARGFRGHLGSLARGRLTTGGLKVVIGGAVGLVAVAPSAGRSLGRLLADAALVALAANVGNLLDRAPGRAIKTGSGLFTLLAVVTTGAAALTGVAVVAGAALALLLDDLHERVMLGDTGANVLGGVVGAGVVVACAPATRNVVLVAVVLVNLAAEMVSFSKVIDAVAPLRAIDRAGRLRHGGSPER